MNVGLMQERLPFVRFEARPIEDREATIKEGHYVAKDAHFVIVQPAGAKDTIEKRVDEWLANFERTNPDLGRRYAELYDRWKRGEELPVDGTPLKNWPVASPAQIANLIAINIRTVEELANANDAALNRYGMGARALQQQAVSWLKSADDVGKVAQMNAHLKTRNEELEKQNKELMAEVEVLRKNKEPAPRAKRAASGDSE